MASRDLNLLSATIRPKAVQLKQLCVAKGINIIYTCTAREFKEQVALYAQGRQPLAEVNTLRKICSMPPISEEANKRCITWTLASKHIINLDDTNPNNDVAHAFDIAVCANNVPVWDVKVDVNHDNAPDYVQVGEIGESIGLKWGGRFSTPDMPHFEE